MRLYHQTVEPRHNKRPSGFLISSEAGQDRHVVIYGGLKIGINRQCIVLNN